MLMFDITTKENICVVSFRTPAVPKLQPMRRFRISNPSSGSCEIMRAKWAYCQKTSCKTKNQQNKRFQRLNCCAPRRDHAQVDGVHDVKGSMLLAVQYYVTNNSN